MAEETRSNNTNQQADAIANIGINHGDVNFPNAKTVNVNIPGETKPVSRVLTRKLLEAIKDYSPKANIFLRTKIAEADKANWEMRVDGKYISGANDAIISSYVSVLGVLFQQLTACSNTRQYFELGITLAKRSLQLLNFSFISALQRYLKVETNQLAESPPELLQTFFTTQYEPDISEYAKLLSDLITLFSNQHINYPIAEIKEREDDFKRNGAFFLTCMKLNQLAASSDSGLPSVDEIETLLTDFLVGVNFLAAYKMISIKDISYEEAWHKDDVRGRGYNNRPQYLYSYKLLGFSQTDKYQYADKPLSNEAVLLFKTNYWEGFSIFPFVIDYNNIIDEPSANICFFTCYEDEMDDNTDTIRKIIRYFKSDKISSGPDNTDVIIKFDEDVENALSSPSNQDIITRFKTEDSKKFIAKKENEVFKAFEDVKTTILGFQE